MPQDRPPTAVVCDDRPDVRRSVTALLAACGYAPVGEAEDFAAVRRLVREERPALVVLALPVPGSSSIAAVATLRADAPGCSVVVLSAFEQLELAALEAGAAALVPEADLQTLRTVLRSMAEGAAAAGPPAPRTPGQAAGSRGSAAVETEGPARSLA